MCTKVSLHPHGSYIRVGGPGGIELSSLERDRRGHPGRNPSQSLATPAPFPLGHRTTNLTLPSFGEISTSRKYIPAPKSLNLLELTEPTRERIIRPATVANEHGGPA